VLEDLSDRVLEDLSERVLADLSERVPVDLADRVLADRDGIPGSSGSARGDCFVGSCRSGFGTGLVVVDGDRATGTWGPGSWISGPGSWPSGLGSWTSDRDRDPWNQGRGS